jgi:hypothetical protein
MNLLPIFCKTLLVSLYFLVSCIPLTVFAAPVDTGQVDVMQKVIDQQQQEINSQSQQLKSLQQRLDEQQKSLEALQIQLQTLVIQKESESVENEQADKASLSQDGSAETADDLAAESSQPPDETAASDTRSSAPTVIQAKGSISDPLLALDIAPLDVPQNRGAMIYSADGEGFFRIYGSIRALAVYDNRQNFHPYDLNIPQVPTGDADVKDWNQEWTMNTTKVGFQGSLNDDFIALAEFDWKGESGDALRIRHMYMRTAHWLVGRHWNAMNTVSFLPQSIDSHSTSAHFGVRPTQIKYLGGKGNWAYQAALDYYQPKFDEPATVDASKRNMIPNIIGNVSYVRPWGLARVGAMLSSNRVRYTYGDEPRSTSSDAGLALLAGIKASINENNLIKAHIQRADGNSQYGADYGFGNYDMTFNPNTGEFQNIKSWGLQVALEHKWTPTLSTTIGAGYMSMDSKNFQPGDSFDHGYKALVNLFYRPVGWLKGFTVAGELEFAGQTTLDESDGSTTRISVLMYYDF